MLEISEQESKYLLELLEATHKDMLHEINHTDTRDYKNMLKEKIAVVDELTAKINKLLENK
jgi:hypothetical protein